MTAEKPDLRAALNRAFSLGQRYWADADSESYAANKRSDVTLANFRAFVDETCAAYEACGCREGTCESKPIGCRMAREIAEGGHQ